MESHPGLQRCVVCCVHCGIRFLTDRRNAGRRDLRCPFGCRRHHRRQCANQRSSAYCRTAEGRLAKKLRNARRSCRQVAAIASPPELEASPPSVEPPSAEERAAAESRPTPELQLGDVVLDGPALACSPMLPYVRMLVRLIDGVKLTCREVLSLLRESLRQRSIAMRRRIDYVLGFLHQHPP